MRVPVSVKGVFWAEAYVAVRVVELPELELGCWIWEDMVGGFG